MTSSFPTALDNLATTKADATASFGDHPAHHNNLAAAINAIESEARTGTVFNVKHYGALGDGTTDDAAAINSAITAANTAGGGIALIPPGTYLLETSIVPKSNVWLCGAGWQNTILKIKNSTNIDAIDTTANVYNAHFTDFCIDGNKTNQTSNGIGIKGWYDKSIFTRLWFQNIRLEAIYLCPTDGYAATGYPTGNAFLNWVHGIEIADSDIGIRYTYLCNDSWIGPRVNIGSTTANIYVTSQGSPVHIFDNWLNGSPTYNIHYPSGGDNIFIKGNVMENAGQHAILITEPASPAGDNLANIHIVGNFIKNSSRTTANTYDLVHIEGYSATKHSVGGTITGNTFITDTNTPRYAVYLKHVKKFTITGNDSQVMGTDYWKLDGDNDAIKIQGNVPNDWPEEQNITTDVTINNTVTETNLVSKNVVGGDLVLDRRLRVTMEGTYLNNSGAARTLQLKVKYGATTLIDVTTGNITANATSRGWKMVVELSNQGATNVQLASIEGVLGAVSTAASGVASFHDASATEAWEAVGTGTAAEDSTADKTFAVTATHSAADANLTLLMQSAVLEWV